MNGKWDDRLHGWMDESLGNALAVWLFVCVVMPIVVIGGMGILVAIVGAIVEGL